MECIALKTKNAADQIALRGVRVHSRLAALGQKTTIEQSFVNLEDQAVEAVYTFPLPAGAAVCHFEVVTDDRVLTGEVEEAGKAEDQYDEAISEGHAAFLLEQNRPDIFTINVGNLKPKQAVSEEFGLLCSQTSFIAIEHRSLEERNDGQPAFRRVPVQLAHGWGGIQAAQAAGGAAVDSMLSSFDIDIQPKYQLAASGVSRSIARRMFSARLYDRLAAGRARFRGPASAARPPAPAFADPLLELLASQQAQGWFEWGSASEGLLKALGGSRDRCRCAIQAALPDSAGERDIRDLPPVVDTLIVLFLLRTKYSDREKMWKRAHDKAVRYVTRHMGTSEADVDQYLAILEGATDLAQS